MRKSQISVHRSRKADASFSRTEPHTETVGGYPNNVGYILHIECLYITLYYNVGGFWVLYINVG
jgi:hypothetical protein